MPTTYFCPACGQRMVLRTGKNTGWEFYGCSRFPACTGMRTTDGKVYATKGKRYGKTRANYYSNSTYNTAASVWSGIPSRDAAAILREQATQRQRDGMRALANAMAWANPGTQYVNGYYNYDAGYSVFAAIRRGMQALANFTAFASDPAYIARGKATKGMANLRNFMAFAGDPRFAPMLPVTVRPARDITAGVYLTSAKGTTIHVHGDKLGIGFSWLREHSLRRPGSAVNLGRDEIAQLTRYRTV